MKRVFNGHPWRGTLITGLVLLGACGIVYAQSAPDAAIVDTVSAAAKEDGGTVALYLKMWADCAHYRMLLGLTLAAGAMGAALKWRQNLHQYKIESMLSGLIDVDKTGFGELLEKARDYRKNLFASLMLTIGKAVEHQQPERIDGLVESYRNHEEGRMRNFSRWMTYASGACGALGLLGTVEGIATTFNTSNFDKKAALIGMGIALATTFIGLVFSLVIDFLANAVNMNREKRTQRNLLKVDELKLMVYDAVAHRR
jgi:biopolymer transport protein ExbB/TolQ